MAISAQTSDSNRSGIMRTPAIWLSILLWCAVAVCAWLIWEQISQMREKSELEKTQIAELQKREGELRNILSLSPCDAKARLETLHIQVAP